MAKSLTRLLNPAVNAEEKKDFGLERFKTLRGKSMEQGDPTQNDEMAKYVRKSTIARNARHMIKEEN